MCNPDAYKAYSARARRAIEAGRFPPDVLEWIERELDDTLPTLKLFTPGSPLRDDLRELLCAWVVCRSDESLGYVCCVLLLSSVKISGDQILLLTNITARHLASISSLQCSS